MTHTCQGMYYFKVQVFPYGAFAGPSRFVTMGVNKTQVQLVMDVAYPEARTVTVSKIETEV